MTEIEINDEGYEYSGPNLVDNYSHVDCDEIQSLLDDRVVTTRSWLDYRPVDYCIKYISKNDIYLASNAHRTQYLDNASKNRDQFWSTFYSNLYFANKNYLSSIQDSLWEIKKERKLDRTSFANMVVSFVQDIPYSFILETEKCEDQNGLFFDCLTGEKLGILSPVEFLHTLRGDCDTRTILLYSLLKHFGYRPKVAVSWVYLHSMLLLDVPSAGSYIVHEGEPFYFWETTSTGWRAGEISPDMSNINNWKILLY